MVIPHQSEDEKYEQEKEANIGNDMWVKQKMCERKSKRQRGWEV